MKEHQRKYTIRCVKKIWNSSPGRTGWLPQREPGLECEKETQDEESEGKCNRLDEIKYTLRETLHGHGQGGI